MKILLCVSGYGRKADGCCKIPLPSNWNGFIQQVKEITRDTLGVHECDPQEIRMTYVDQESDKCAITKLTYGSFTEDASLSKKSCKVNIQYFGDKSAVRLLPEVSTVPRRRRRPLAHREWDLLESDTTPLPRDAFFTGVTENSSTHSYTTALQDTVSPPQTGIFSDTSVSVASDYFGASSNLIESEFLSAYRNVAIEEKKSRRSLLLDHQHSSVIGALVIQELKARNSIEADLSVESKQLSFQRLRSRPPSAPHMPLLLSQDIGGVRKPCPPRHDAPNSAPAGRFRQNLPMMYGGPPIPPPSCGWLENPIQNDILRTLRNESENRHQIQFQEDAAVSNLETLHTKLWIQAALASSRRELEIEQLQVDNHPGSWGSAEGSTNEESQDVFSSGSSEERITIPATYDDHPPPAKQDEQPKSPRGKSCLKPPGKPKVPKQLPGWPQGSPFGSSKSIQPMLQAAMPFLLWPMLGALTDLRVQKSNEPTTVTPPPEQSEAVAVLPT